MKRPLLIDVRKRNNLYSFSYIELFIFFIYIFLSTFETYLVPYIGNISKYVMILIILFFVIKDCFETKLRITLLSISFIAWLGFKFISIYVGGYNDIISLHLISQIGFVLLLIPIFSHEFKKTDCNLIILMFWIVSLLFNFLSIILKQPYQGIYSSRQVLTLFGQQNDPNNCAAFSLVGFSISLYIMLFKKKYFILCSVALILSFAAIVISGSRAGLLAAIIVILVCFFIRKPFTLSRFLIRLSIFLLIAVISFFVSYNVLPRETFLRLFDFFSEGGSGRLSLWQSAFTLFKSRPLFGYGWGTATYYGKVFPQAVHNTFISMLAENGIVGLSLFLIPCIYLYIKSIKAKQLLPFLFIISALLPAFFIDSINKRFLWNGLIMAYFAFGIVDTSQANKKIVDSKRMELRI